MRFGEVQAKIADTEQKIATKRALVQHKAASQKLTRNLDEVERVLPDHLGAARRFVGALEPNRFDYEANEMARSWQHHHRSRWLRASRSPNCGPWRTRSSMVRHRSRRPSRTGRDVEPPPPTMTVFMLRSAKYRDNDGR